MSRKHYVKYSQMNKEENNEVVIDKPSFEDVDDLGNQIVEGLKEGLETDAQNDEELKQPEPIPAVVSGCTKLRVRRGPSTDAGLYGTIEEGTELTVDAEEANEDFYKVYTEINGTLIEGYCMKKFIKLK